LVAALHRLKPRARLQILNEALRLGRTRGESNPDMRKILVVYNPISGGGIAKKLVTNMVEPM
jgi:hypothetical protein